MNETLFLGIDVSDLPQELKEGLVNASNAFRRLRKAEIQFGLWKTELHNAHAFHNAAQDTYTTLLARWNPETKTMAPGPEELKQ